MGLLRDCTTGCGTDGSFYSTSNLHDCLQYKRTGCSSGSWTADTYLVTNPHGGRGQHQGGSYHDGPHISRPGLCCNYVTLGSCEVMFRNKSLASLCSLYLMCASSRQQPPGRSRSCGGRGRRWSGKQINANIYQTCLNLEKSFQNYDYHSQSLGPGI